MPTEHRLETRARLLSERLQHARQTIRDAVAPAGQRPPFTEQLSKPEALRFWQAHRFDEYGQAALARMAPEQVQELDLALARANEAQMYAPPVEGDDGVW
jgi:hypothetical protein